MSYPSQDLLILLHMCGLVEQLCGLVPVFNADVVPVDRYIVTQEYAYICAIDYNTICLFVYRYIDTFEAGFDKGISSTPVYFMQSDGGLTEVGSFSGHKAILSGPAGTRRERGSCSEE